MRAFSAYNPIAVFINLTAAIIIAMFVQNPIIILISFIGSILFYIMIFKKLQLKTMFFGIFTFIAIALVNPIFSHNGETVLIFINEKAITLEALLYGANNGLMILSVMVWFLSFSEIMTSDKIMYIFGKISPRLSLFLSMSVRYIPLYRNRATEINNAQKVMGLYKDNNIVDDIRGIIRILSSLITWSLEKSVDTADSFYARGGEIKGRSSFSLFKFKKSDLLLITGSLILFGVVVLGKGTGCISFDFYASGSFLGKLNFSIFSVMAYFSYFILVMMPFILERFARK